MSKLDYLTVTQLTTYLKRKFDYDPYLQRVYLTGEISNFRLRPHNHQYFSLKDDHAKINAIMFKSAFSKVKFTPETGMKVQVVGRIGLYPPTGAYQIYVDRMEPDGVGALYQAYEQLKRRLDKEGLFTQNQRPLPRYPKKIAVITSRSGAVIRDIVTTSHRRDPKVQLILFPAVVQGDQAARSLVERLQQVYQYDDFDMIIIGRGGGSIEDLWPFNEESVARMMGQSPIPIISSVGHETDTTIADLVADVRAATPTAAAELATPELTEVLTGLQQARLRLIHAFQRRCQIARSQYEIPRKSFIFKQPQRLYQGYSQQLDLLEQRFIRSGQQYLQQQQNTWQNLSQRLLQRTPAPQIKTGQLQLHNLIQRLQRSMSQVLQQKKQGARQQIGNLDQLSPLHTLARGYTYASDEKQRPLVNIDDFKPEQVFQLHLLHGKIKAQVLSKEHKDDE